MTRSGSRHWKILLSLTVPRGRGHSTQHRDHVAAPGQAGGRADWEGSVATASAVSMDKASRETAQGWLARITSAALIDEVLSSNLVGET